LEHQKLIVGNKKKKEKKPDKKIMKIKKEKVNRHYTSEEYRVCAKFCITFRYIDICSMFVFLFIKIFIFINNIL